MELKKDMKKLVMKKNRTAFIKETLRKLIVFTAVVFLANPAGTQEMTDAGTVLASANSWTAGWRSTNTAPGWRNGATLQGGATVATATTIPYEEETAEPQDTDDDKIADDWEYLYFGNLTTAELQSDGTYTDYDNDGLNDYYEYLSGTKPQTEDIYDTTGDADDDGLDNSTEQFYGTNPALKDTDGDGLTDFEEVNMDSSYALDPFLPYQPRYLKLASNTEAVFDDFSQQTTLNNFTIEMWVKPSAANFSARLLTKQNKYLTKDEYRLFVQDDVVKFALGRNSGIPVGKLDGVISTSTDPYNSYVTTFSNFELPANEWTHLSVVVWTGTTSGSGYNIEMRAYTDGVEYEYTQNIKNTVSLSSTAGPLVLGNKLNNLTAFDVDEVRVWDDNRSESELLRTRSLTIFPDTTGVSDLAVNFPMDDKAGRNALETDDIISAQQLVLS
ncbi:MAG: LamG domain-containing protein, partial [Lentisphaeria bacterium]